MLSEAARRFSALPTTVKLLLILSAALLPIGAGLVWVASQSIQDANSVLRVQAEEQARLAARGVESLIARNALALRIAANGRVSDDPGSCAAISQSLTVTPAVAQKFELETDDGQRLCEIGEVPDTASLPLVAPGDVALRISTDRDALTFRLGVTGGMATGVLSRDELRRAALDAAPNIDALVLREGASELPIIVPSAVRSNDRNMSSTRWQLAGNRLEAEIGNGFPMITTGERLILLLPFLMWIVAALITWVLVTRLLIRPLRQLQRSVGSYQPGDSELALPR
ncbi:MAG TPA: hypothetical protein VJ775_01770, partial [Sphingomicrobium sp.]|nr:hypothetical protein [Sphingomicrobium sp.]